MKKINTNRVITGWSNGSSFKFKESAGYRLCLFPNGNGGHHTQWVRKEKINYD